MVKEKCPNIHIFDLGVQFDSVLSVKIKILRMGDSV